MTCFRFPGVLPTIACLLAISCDQGQHETEAEFPIDTETAQIKGELHLMNLSQDVKSRTLTFGESTAFTGTKKVPTQTTRIHEKNYYICPLVRNPRLLLMGKIRVEVRRENEDSTYYGTSR